MIQRGESASFFVLVILAVIVIAGGYLGSMLDNVSVTGAVVTPSIAPSEQICGEDQGVCFSLGFIVACSIAIGAIELTRKRRH